MAAGDLITADNQVEWNGLLLGTVDTGWRLTGLTGWLDLPDMRDTDVDLPSEHGQRPGQSLAAARIITATFAARVDPGSATEADAVRAATAPIDQPEEAPLVIQRAGLKHQVMARAVKRAIPQDLVYAGGLVQASIQWKATNPRLLRLPQQAPSVGLAAVSSGLAWPAAWPAAWGSGSAAGELVVTNLGNAPAQPVIEFLGPLTGPWVRDADSGRQLGTLTDYELAAGQTVYLDQQYKTVLLGSGDAAVSRSNELGTRQWFTLPPGTTRLVWGHAGSYDPAASMTCRYYHTDL